MLSLIEQIKSGSLWDFPGGVHPQENKTQSNRNEIVRAAVPSELVIPLKQHIGKPGDLLVNIGDTVLKGQPLSQVNAAFMLPVHAPTSGTIKAIEPRTIAHPSGLSDLCIVIEADGEDTWTELSPVEDYRALEPDALIETIRLAGISGMGGAGFPTAKKIQSGLQRTEILILNAAECEPYITADDRLMQDCADEVIEGINILKHMLKPKLTIIGIEDNKPEAIKALEKAATSEDIVIRVIPTKYPSGGEKQLIKILTNLEVPVGGIPADIGLMVQNIGSAFAIKRAVCQGEPLIERVVTLTGKTFKQPRNVWTRIGTPVQALLDEFGYKADKKSQRLIMGGPMMGFTLPHANVPITKTANCILAPTFREIDPRSHEIACIRCSQCAEACPASLLPQQLQWYAKSQEYDKCEELNLKDCIECGACAFVCPSEIPLVQYYRQAKAEIRTRKQDADAAERAKVRFEEKKARMERDKAERENRFKKAADDRRKQMSKSGGDDAIAAAIERVKAQKAKAETTSEVKPAVAAAIARAKAKQAEAAKQAQAEPDNSEMAKLREERKRQARERKAEKASAAEDVTAETSADVDPKKAAIAAALARAKAKKAAQQQDAPSDSDSQESKKDAVAAAIARAKARKQAAQTETTENEAAPENDAKKEAVAAAIARAKARKQSTQSASTETESLEKDSEAPSSEDPKKAAVAAAIARAKARKQAVQAEPEEAKSETPASEADDPKKAAVAAAIARAKARKQAAQVEPEEANSEAPASEADDPKKAAVAAAIARAKARKQAAQVEPEEAKSETPASEADDPKKAAVAAAIARAKARKQAAQAEPEKMASETPASEAEDPKKAAVAAAVARAKARKQAAQTEPEKAESAQPEQPKEVATETATSESDDPKKAAVAAAIARAKARKRQQEQNKENN